MEPSLAEMVFPGQLAPATLDRYRRPVIQNPDGSFSTERSFSTNLGGRETLLPTIVQGRTVTPEAAIAHYRRTGEHLGQFRTPADADAYANATHDALAQFYQRLIQSQPPLPPPRGRGQPY